MKFKIIDINAFKAYEKFITNKSIRDVFISIAEDALIVYLKGATYLSKVIFPIECEDFSNEFDSWLIPADKFWAVIRLLNDNNHTFSIQKKMTGCGTLEIKINNDVIILPITFRDDTLRLSFRNIFDEAEKVDNFYIYKLFANREDHKDILLMLYKFIQKANSFFGSSIIDMMSLQSGAMIISNERMIIEESIPFGVPPTYFSPSRISLLKDIFNTEHEEYELSFAPDGKALIKDKNFLTVFSFTQQETAPTPQMIETLKAKDHLFSVKANELLNHISFFNAFYDTSNKAKKINLKLNSKENLLTLSLKDTATFQDNFLVERTFSVEIGKELKEIGDDFFELSLNYSDLLFLVKDAENATLKVHFKKNADDINNAISVTLDKKESDIVYILSYSKV